MSRMVSDIAEEMLYPLIPPVVSCQSHFSSYFHAFPALNLLRVPLREAYFLLHLPDLYHELAHFILTEQNNPVVDPFLKTYTAAATAARGHLATQLSKPSRGPKGTERHLRVWITCWVGAWATELFCDLFGTLAVGPAYGWGHLHLCAKRGGDPFLVETSPDSSHPPDEARMFVILEALVGLGYEKEATAIEEKWRNLHSYGGYKVNADYQLCFRKDVLKRFAEEALTGYRAMHCRCSSPRSGNRLHDLLNKAWKEFWKAPAQYPAWEQAKQAELFLKN
jgi:hypothetical protein